MLSIIVPCCNERSGIPRLVEALRDTRRLLAPTTASEWVFVDDGSTDGTAEALEAATAGDAQVTIVRHARNRGLGAALRTGFSAARGDLIATMDSDCTYDPRLLLPMLGALREDVDAVLASPYHPDGRVEQVPGYRLFLSRGLSRLYNLVVGARLHTYTSLFRVYRRPVIEAVRFESDGFVAMAELVVEALRQGFRVVEYPATLTVRQSGSSKAAVVRLIGQHLAYLRRIGRRPAAASGPAPRRPDAEPSREDVEQPVS